MHFILLLCTLLLLALCCLSTLFHSFVFSFHLYLFILGMMKYIQNMKMEKEEMHTVCILYAAPTSRFPHPCHGCFSSVPVCMPAHLLSFFSSFFSSFPSLYLLIISSSICWHIFNNFFKIFSLSLPILYANLSGSFFSNQCILSSLSVSAFS